MHLLATVCDLCPPGSASQINSMGVDGELVLEWPGELAGPAYSFGLKRCLDPPSEQDHG